MSDLSAPCDQAPVDFERALAALEDDITLLVEVVEMLLDQIDVDLLAIQAHVKAGNSSAIAASSHRLKGSLGAIAAVPAFQACTELTKSARSGAMASYVPNLSRLEHELDRLRPCLHDWLAEQSK